MAGADAEDPRAVDARRLARRRRQDAELAFETRPRLDRGAVLEREARIAPDRDVPALRAELVDLEPHELRPREIGLQRESRRRGHHLRRLGDDLAVRHDAEAHLGVVMHLPERRVLGDPGVDAHHGLEGLGAAVGKLVDRGRGRMGADAAAERARADPERSRLLGRALIAFARLGRQERADIHSVYRQIVDPNDTVGECNTCH